MTTTRTSVSAQADARACRLATLAPLRLQPAVFSTRTRVVLELRRVEGIAVEPDSAGHYRICVYYKSQSNHIPLYDSLNTALETPSVTFRAPRDDRKADVVTLKTLVDVLRLRDDLFQLARNGHNLQPCAFCHEVISYGGYGRAKPHRSLVWLYSTETVCVKLTMYMNDVLDIVRRAKAFTGEDCDGHTKIPLLLHRFLRLHCTSAPL